MPALICLAFGKVARLVLLAVLLPVFAPALGSTLRVTQWTVRAVLPARFDGFAAGFLVAVLMHGDSGRCPSACGVVPAVQACSPCFVSASCMASMRGGASRTMGMRFSIWAFRFFAVLGAAIIVLISAHCGHWVLSALQVRPMVFLGEMSYLWHYPVIVRSTMLMISTAMEVSRFNFWLQLLLCYAVAMVAQLLIERPLSKYRKTQRSNPPVT